MCWSAYCGISERDLCTCEGQLTVGISERDICTCEGQLTVKSLREISVHVKVSLLWNL